MNLLRGLWTWLKRLLRFTGRVLGSFLKNRGILLAGGVGYNALLSLLPFLTLAVAVLSFFFDKARILGYLRPELRMLVPQHADALLQTPTVSDVLHDQQVRMIIGVPGFFKTQPFDKLAHTRVIFKYGTVYSFYPA